MVSRHWHRHAPFQQVSAGAERVADPVSAVRPDPGEQAQCLLLPAAEKGRQHDLRPPGVLILQHQHRFRLRQNGAGGVLPESPLLFEGADEGRQRRGRRRGKLRQITAEAEGAAQQEGLQCRRIHALDHPQVASRVEISRSGDRLS